MSEAKHAGYMWGHLPVTNLSLFLWQTISHALPQKAIVKPRYPKAGRCLYFYNSNIYIFFLNIHLIESCINLCFIGTFALWLLGLPGFWDIATPPVCLSVCPSVCPSVTFSFRTVTQKHIDVFSRNFTGTCTMSWGCAV